MNSEVWEVRSERTELKVPVFTQDKTSTKSCCWGDQREWGERVLHPLRGSSEFTGNWVYGYANWKVVIPDGENMVALCLYEVYDLSSLFQQEWAVLPGQ